MGVQICACNKNLDFQSMRNSDLPLENYSIKPQKIIYNKLKKKKDSFCLPNGNNMNSFYDMKDNQNNPNDVERFDISLSPITNARKNINLNNESSNIKNYSSCNNNMSSINCVETNKQNEQNKPIPEDDPVQEESLEKEESNNLKEEGKRRDSNKEFVKNEEKMKKMIEIFDKNIKKYAEYISNGRISEIERSEIRNLEDGLEQISAITDNNFQCFKRPALKFKSDNSIYKGSWNVKGQKEGFGVFLDSKGNKYVGYWRNDKFNGKGRLLSVKGDYFEGYFKDGIIEGQGMFYSKNIGYKYLGDFKNNKCHGNGKMIYENKMTYEGAFIEGYKDGQGKLTFSDGVYYEGDFKKNNFDGKGKFIFNDGRNYNGDWKNNAMNGKGIFSWENGDKYNGEYKNNVKEGNGVYSYGCNLYDGNWVNNKPHGEGTLLCDGVRIEGYFRYGKILEMIDGRGANRELTLKLTVNSKIHNKSLDDTSKGIEIMNESRFARTEKGSEIVSKRGKKSKTKNEESLYSKKSRKKEDKNDESFSSKKIKSKNKEKDKEKRRYSKSKSRDKDKSNKKSSKKKMRNSCDVPKSQFLDGGKSK